MEFFELPMNKPVRSFSTGQKNQFEVIMAMCQGADYILMDEAQDFKPSFYQVCRALVKNDCLVWCYDDLQNIFQVEIQDTMKTFANEYGAAGINLGKLQELHPDMDNDIFISYSRKDIDSISY